MVSGTPIIISELLVLSTCHISEIPSCNMFRNERPSNFKGEVSVFL